MIKLNKIIALSVVFVSFIGLMSQKIEAYTDVYTSSYVSVLSGYLGVPVELEVDAQGNTYSKDYESNRFIKKFDTNGHYVMEFGGDGTGDGQFSFAGGIAVDNTGNIYVIDSWTNFARIQKFNSNGVYLMQFGSYGSGDGQFNFPNNITVDVDGNIYVTDVGLDNVQKFDNNGNFLSKFGGTGTGDGQFNSPIGIDIDTNGNLFVADMGNSNIQKFDINGNFLSKFGTAGTGDGEFTQIMDLALDSNNNIYVSDAANGRVQKFDSSGVFIIKFGTQGDGSGDSDYEFYFAWGIGLDSSGNIYLSDAYNRRIQKFDSSGSYISSIVGIYYAGLTNIDINGNKYIYDLNYINKFDSNDQYLGKIKGEGDLAMSLDVMTTDSVGDIYGVQKIWNIDHYNYSVIKINSVGVFQMRFEFGTPGGLAITDTKGIVVDASSYIYILDYINNRVVKYNSLGTFVSEYGSLGVGNGEFTNPTSIDIDGSGNIYIADSGNGRVQKFDSNMTYQTQFAIPESMISIDTVGNIITSSNSTIKMYSPTGVILYEFGTNGLGIGQLGGWLLSFDTTGNGDIYISDTNRRVSKFNYSILERLNYILNTTNTLDIYDSSISNYVAGHAYHATDVPNISISNKGTFFTETATINNWTETGTLVLRGDDDEYVQILPFSFPFNGEMYNSIKIGTNGVICLDITQDCTWYSDPINDTYMGSVIQPMGIDLTEDENFEGNGEGVFVDSTMDSVTIRWKGKEYGEMAQINFSLVLYPSGEFIFQYGNVTNVLLNEPVIGAGAGDGIKYLNSVNNGQFNLSGLNNTIWTPGTPKLHIVDVNLNMSTDRDWTNVMADADIQTGKAFVTGLNGTTGMNGTHSLYIPIPEGYISNRVMICPDANSFNTIFNGCTNSIIKTEAEIDTSKVNVNTINYWKIDGLTGTGGMSLTTDALRIEVSNTNVSINDPITLTVSGLDSLNAIDPLYTGTVSFTSTSGTAILPGDYVFTNTDAGQKVFTNQLIFIEAGSYTVTVHDLDDPTLVVVSETIIVTDTNSPTPTPTAVLTPTVIVTTTPIITNTQIPTPTPTAVLTPTVVVTTTPIITSTSSVPTNTQTPTITTTVNASIIPTITPSPNLQVCTDDPLRVECQQSVVIFNVTGTKQSDTNYQICWETNIDTIGNVKYGFSSAAVYDKSTQVESFYKRLSHCDILTNLTILTKYIYRISSTSIAGKTNSYDAEFTFGLDNLPLTGEDTNSNASECILKNGNGYAFNGSGQVIISFSLTTSAKCVISYGNSSFNNTNKALETVGTQHKSILDLIKINKEKDLYYEINCTFVDKNKNPNQCKTSDVIPVQKYLPYYPEYQITESLLNYFTEFIGDKTQTANLATVSSGLGLLSTGTIVTLTYPHWITYGFLWLFGKKSKKYWGIVFDTETGKPIAFTTVRAKSKETGLQVKQTITDVQGRYGFILDRGEYIIEVTNALYTKDTKEVNINEDAGILIIDIGLQRNSNINVFLKVFDVLKTKLSIISNFIFVICLLLTAFSIYLIPNYINILIFIVYCAQILIIINLRSPRGWGKVTSNDGYPLRGAFVRLFDVEEGRQVDVQLTDKKGRFGFILKDKLKQYMLKVDAPGYKFPGINQNNVFKNTIGESFINVDEYSLRNIDIVLD